MIRLAGWSFQKFIWEGVKNVAANTYDKTSPKSIEAYDKRLIGHTFLDVLEGRLADTDTVAEQAESYGNKNRKGGLGNLLEEAYFGYAANSISAADFIDAGVELKATPYELTRKGEYRAGERLVLSMIDYSKEIETELTDSHMWQKCKLLLLIYYWRNRSLDDNLLYPIQFVSLFTPTSTDLAIIESDYRTIVEKIKAGKAEELSESDTFYLGACTKGATAEKSIVPQFYPPHTPAKKRAFCYKNSYMTYVLNEYIITGTETYEPLIKDPSELADISFTQLIVSRIDAYKGKSDEQLCKMFGREYNNNKAQWTDLTYRMLGIKSNNAAEFKKANIVVKVIRVEEDGNMNECLSFPAFKYKELINEEWENSTLRSYFDETKFFFVVFKRKGERYYLHGSQFWNMPYDDLESDVKSGWQNVVDTIKSGVKLTPVRQKNGIVVKNNLPKKSDNRIIHVRPHTSKTYYEFTDGTIIAKGTKSNANQLPDGTWMTDYSFWINNDYILGQLGI